VGAAWCAATTKLATINQTAKQNAMISDHDGDAFKYCPVES
jgi:hypothetical protein